MTVRSGRKCCELLTGQSPLGSLVRTWLESSRWNSTISYLTWKPSATPRGRLLFRLVPSMPDTDGTECGLWPTPRNGKTTDESEEAWTKRRDAGNVSTPPLTLAVKMWPTASARDWKDSPGMARTGTNPDGSTRDREDQLARRVYGETNQTGSLNPAWVEWLMGYPTGHTVCAAWATPSSRKSRKNCSAQLLNS